MGNEDYIEIEDDVNEGNKDESLDIEIDAGSEETLTEEQLKESGFPDDHIKRLRDDGLIKDEVNNNDGESIDNVDDTVDKDPNNFEDMDKVFEKNEKSFHENYTPNQKALYFKSKQEKSKRQELQRQVGELENKIKSLENGISSGDDSRRKLDAVKDLLKDPNNLPTLEQLQGALISDQQVNEDPNRPLTVADLEKFRQNSIEDQRRNTERSNDLQTRQNYVEQLGKSRYNNFASIVDMATEISKSNPMAAKIVQEAFRDTSVTEDQVVETIVNVARMNSKFWNKSDPKTGVSPETNGSKDIDRMVKNANKSVSTNTVSRGGSRKVSYDQLTPDQISKIPQRQWDTIPKEVREKLVRKMFT